MISCLFHVGRNAKPCAGIGDVEIDCEVCPSSASNMIQPLSIPTRFSSHTITIEEPASSATIFYDAAHVMI